MAAYKILAFLPNAAANASLIALLPALLPVFDWRFLVGFCPRLCLEALSLVTDWRL